MRVDHQIKSLIIFYTTGHNHVLDHLIRCYSNKSSEAIIQLIYIHLKYSSTSRFQQNIAYESKTWLLFSSRKVKVSKAALFTGIYHLRPWLSKMKTRPLQAKFLPFSKATTWHKVKSLLWLCHRCHKFHSPPFKQCLNVVWFRIQELGVILG